MTCFVYVIAHRHGDAGEDVTGPCKIGISSNPATRLKLFQTGYPAHLVLCVAYRFPDKQIARHVEKSFLGYFKNIHPEWCLKGEWVDRHPIWLCQLLAGCLRWVLNHELKLPQQEMQQSYRVVGLEMGDCP
jgi:hypothetical protein